MCSLGLTKHEEKRQMEQAQRRRYVRFESDDLVDQPSKHERVGKLMGDHSEQITRFNVLPSSASSLGDEQSSRFDVLHFSKIESFRWENTRSKSELSYFAVYRSCWFTFSKSWSVSKRFRFLSVRRTSSSSSSSGMICKVTASELCKQRRERNLVTIRIARVRLEYGYFHFAVDKEKQRLELVNSSSTSGVQRSTRGWSVTKIDELHNVCHVVSNFRFDLTLIKAVLTTML